MEIDFIRNLKKFRLCKKELIIIIIFLTAFSINFYRWDALSLFDDRTNVHLLQDFLHGKINMIDGYIGVMFPMILTGILFGVNQFSVRLAVALCIGLTVVFTYLFASDYLGKKAGLLACSILIVFSSFTLSKMSDVPYLAFFPILILFLLYRYRKTKNNLYLYAGAFVSGYSLYHKMINFYFLLALFISLVLIKFLLLKKLKITPPRKVLFISISLFLVGLSPLILYNIQNDFTTILTIRKYFYLTPLNHENLNIIPNLIKKTGQFTTFISEDVNFFGSHTIITLVKRGYNFNLIIFLLSLCLLFFSRKAKSIFLVSLFFVFAFLTTFVPYTMMEIHFFTIYPVIAIIISAALLSILNLKYRPAIFMFLAIFILIMVFNLPSLADGMLFLDNQKLLEKALPTKASIHQRFTETLADEQPVMIPNNFFFELLTHIYPYKNVIEFCNLSYYEKNNTCYFVSCRSEKLFTNIENAKYAFTVHPEKMTYSDMRELDSWCVFPSEACEIDHCENHNYPFEFFVNESIKRGFKIKFERDFSDANGEIVYRTYSIEK